MLSRRSDTPSSDFVGAAVTAIAQLIREQDLRPGDRLPAEAVLSKDLQVSRTVIREALRSLAALRLVELGAGRRPTVAELNDDAFGLMIEHGVVIDQIDIQQIYDARRTIEARTSALAALRRTEAEAKAIIAHAEAMAADFHLPEKVIEHDIAFHLSIARASRNPVFALILGAFQNVTRQTWPIGWRSRANDGDRQAMNALHHEIGQAILAGDPGAATAAMNQHFDVSLKALVTAGLI
ncbi:FadR/GntR family transcriptional regulator [Rhizobium halophilum]|uniref:FadR/GntR family transcriptional regulator n=1 Tax=Rhizobium halophilum TaxID=2846852 RepID=UPI001EFE2DD5|nr:FadR/GntR family transcriptional regulator [Rhizobium halophilum]MCF6370233.1 FadR family transcriptional regulator [Rhizobium halophilum]